MREIIPELVRPIAESGTAILELLGILIIVGTALYTVGFGALELLKRDDTQAVFRDIRQRLGRGILLGLEFLVAADIVYTVAVELTFSTVAVLAIIVLIRTFLSFTLEVELTGRWPWQDNS